MRARPRPGRAISSTKAVSGPLHRACFAAAVLLAAAPASAQTDDAAQRRPDAAQPTDLIATYQVRAGESENLSGRLRVVDPRTGEVRPVRRTGLLLINEGRIVGRAETAADGVVRIRDLAPDAYSVVAVGPDGMGVFGMEVLAPAAGATVPEYRFDALIAPSADIAAAQRALAGGAAAVSPPDVVRRDPPDARRAPRISAVPFSDAANAAVEAAAPLRGDAIPLRDGEAVAGRLVAIDPDSGRPAPLANARVLVLRSGRVLGSISTDAEGFCGIAGLEEGVYSIVGRSDGGLIAMGLAVTRVDGPDAVDIEGAGGTFEFVARLQPGPAFEAPGAGPDAVPFAPGFGAPGPPPPGGIAPPPFAAGGFGGQGAGPGGAGGGGGGGGGGLLGALLGAGIAGGIGAALAGDDDDDSRRAPRSPNGPPFTPPGPPSGVPPGPPDFVEDEDD